MTMRKRRERAERRRREWQSAQPEPICPACGRPGRHFVPPSLGEPGFLICKVMP